MATSPRTGKAPSRHGRPSAAPAPSVTELRDAVKTASQLARSTRKEAKEAASELKRLSSALDKARKAAAKEKAAAREKAAATPARAAGKPIKPTGKTAPRAAVGNGQQRGKPGMTAGKVSTRRGRPPKVNAVAPAAVAAA